MRIVHTNLRIARTAQYILIYLLTYVCLEAFLRLQARFIYELHGPITADTPLYWAVGRGILNGLTPYADLWESKPPGIFLLSALSYWLFDNMILGRFVQGIALAGPAVLMALGTTAYQKQLGSLRAYGLPMLGFILGALMGLYSGARSGEFQVESFGAFFGIIYLTILAFHKYIPRYWYIGTCTTALFFAIGFKEPFVFSCIAGALLMIEHPRRMRDSIIFPIILTTVIGVLIMLLLGYLWPYISIHLADRLLEHNAPAIILLRRGFRIRRILDDIGAYSQFLRLSIVLLGVSFLYHRMREWRQGVFLLVFKCCAFAAAIFLAAFSVGIGGEYFNHHYIFALPVYGGLFYVFGQDVMQYATEWITRLLVLVIGTICCLALLQLPVVNYHNRIANLQRDEAREKQIAAVIDSILTSCAVEQYLFLGSNGRKVYGYTKHSPLGPVFFQYNFMFDRPFFRNALDRQFQQAQIIVFDRYHLGRKAQEARAYVEQHFTQDPWPCVPPGHLDTGSYSLLYRIIR